MLNITSLMDVLTIILIFLVYNFSSEETDARPPKGFELPASTSARQLDLAIKVSVGPTDVRVEDRVVAHLAKGHLRTSEVGADKRIDKLVRELEREKARLQSSASSEARLASDEDEGEIVYLEAAAQTPYDVLDTVMKSAAAAGFAKFRVAVLRK